MGKIHIINKKGGKHITLCSGFDFSGLSESERKAKQKELDDKIKDIKTKIRRKKAISEEFDFKK